jgi:phage regulator Rha-like protein
MFNIVHVKNNNVFTDSLIMAEGTKYEHHTITRKIRDFKKDFEQLGNLDVTSKYTGGNPQKIYLLNEMQASYLVTLLENNEIVRRFKLNLVKEFYRMRIALFERQTSEWRYTRINGKTVRLKETGVLARLKIYAEEQREGKEYSQIYINYTKLVNNAVGIKTGGRDIATFKQLQIISMLEDMIEKTVAEEMEKGVYFKEIYKKCKNKVDTVTSLLYVEDNGNLPLVSNQ